MSKKQKLYPQMVVIEWQDASAQSGWWSKTDALDWADYDYMVRTVGFIVKETDEAVTVAQSWHPMGKKDAQPGELFKVPRGMISKITPMPRT